MRKYNRSQHSLFFFKSLNLVLVLVTTGMLIYLNFSFNDSYAQNNHEKPSLYFVSTPDIQCPESITEGPTYTDENGCIQPCPIDPQGVLPEECVQQQPSTSTSTSSEQLTPEELTAGDEESAEEQESSPLQQNNATLSEEADQLNQNNLVDSSQDLIFQNDKLLKPNFPHLQNYGGKGYLTIKAYAVNFTQEQADRISICVDTQVESGKKIMASPHCTFGANKAFKYAVQPGQVVLSIKSDLGTGANESPCHFNISLGESKTCTLNFAPLFEVPKSKNKFDLPKLTAGP
jgi:hypothetical protein